MTKKTAPFMPDLSKPEISQSPYAVYEKLHEQGEIYWDERVQAWIISSYEDCATILRDERFSTTQMKIYLPRLPVESRETLMPLFNRLETWMLFQDGEEHKRLRTPITKAFDSRLMKLWESKVQNLTEALLAPLAGAKSFDLLEAIAYPLPIGIISAMLGIETEDQEQLREWTTDLVQFLDNSTDFENAARALSSNHSISEYLRAQIERYRAAPADNLISYLLNLQKENPQISDDDIVGNAVLLFAAGHETTTAGVSNTTALIARSPEARDAVARDPSCLSTCVEETLRFDPPVHRTGRIAQEDILFKGVPFQKGERLSLLLGAANRDPDQFTTPNQYRYDRHPNRHLAFSMGRHFCVGAHLARIQATVANREIFKLFPNLSIDETGIEWRPNLSLRSMIRCPVSL